MLICKKIFKSLFLSLLKKMLVLLYRITVICFEVHFNFLFNAVLIISNTYSV